MASEKVARILRSRTELSSEEIQSMSDGEAWRRVYSLPKRAKTIDHNGEICFTGFSPSQKSNMQQAAQRRGFKVVKSVTKRLAFLCAGPNAGPSKLQKARQCGATILSLDELTRMLETGEVPANDVNEAMPAE
jgi:NAD-dependent DNA ligase